MCDMTTRERRSIAWFLAAALSVSVRSAAQPPSPPSSLALEPSLTTALVGGTLIDGTGAAPIRNAAVVIQGERVVAAGPRDAVIVPDAARAIDVEDGTILPGFINAHVHGAYNLDRLEAWAQAGVTTVRDLSTGIRPIPFALRDQARQEPRYARLVVAGTMITVPGGYPSAIWGVESLAVSSPEKARRAVDDLLDQGADVIKIAVESGADFGRVLPMLSPEQIAAIVDEAHRRGTRVSAHVLVAADLALAVDGGVDDIAHMVTDYLPAGLIGRMLADDVYWVPTLELWENVGHGRADLAVRNLSTFAAAGGKTALGTDFAGYTTPFQLGMPMIEVELMSEAGMSPMQIIVAATRNAAHVCNLEEDLGTLEAGKMADILVIDGDPLEDLHTLSNVRWVIHGGTVIRSPSP